MGKRAHTDFERNDVVFFLFFFAKIYLYTINWEDHLSFNSEWRLRLQPFSQRTAGPRYLITPRECLICGAFVEVLKPLVNAHPGAGESGTPNG